MATGGADNLMAPIPDIRGKVSTVEEIIFKFYDNFSTYLTENYNIDPICVEDSLYHLLRNYSRVSSGQLPTYIDFDDKSICIAYLKRYATCHTTVVYKEVSNFLSSENTDISSVFDNINLNITFLGSGPGNDVLGFLMALCQHRQKKFELNLTMVDKCVGWHDVFEKKMKIIKKLSNSRLINNISSYCSLNSSFITEDLTEENFSHELKETLLKTDVLLLVKVLSHIPNAEKPQVLQNITENLKSGCVMVVIDWPYKQNHFLKLKQKMTTVYTSEKNEYILKSKIFNNDKNLIKYCRAETRMFKKA